ncbi:MAG: tetratricopeptide repeat protein [Woeseiaceae bacterium]|nr:tetratricopeptide repeat protein [Woeseiaceae bacterium]
MKPELLQGFYLGDILIEPLKRQVTGRGISAQLTPKASEVLLQLASAPSSLVTIQFLLEKVWGEGHGTPEELHQVVDEILIALQDSIDDPQHIQTLPQRGYRLIVAPRLLENNTSSSVIGAKGGSNVSEHHILQDLQQRGVLEAGVAYLIIGWLLIQLADVIFDQLYLPQWAGTFVTVLVIAGFPIALVLSWYLEFRDGRAVIDTGSHTRVPRGRVRRTRLSIIGALVIASIIVFSYDRLVGLPEETAPTSIATSDPTTSDEDILPVESNSIAVLKFLNVDGGERTEIFASGFAEEMINRLARLPTMSVASRGDAWSLGTSASSDDVRQRLRVAYYVEGSVRLIGESLSVNVRLVDSLTGFQMTSRKFDEKIEDFNQVLQEIINVTVANLRIALPPETQTILNSMYQETDVDAYILYRKGKEIYEQPRTPENLSKAIDLYEQALAFDPVYAAAHAGLCDAYIALYNLSNSSEDIERAESECSTALTSNPRLHMVYAALGELYLRLGRVTDAESAFNKALQINSQDVPATRGLADVYRRSQRFAQAEDLLNAVISAQPGNWRAINSLGTFLFTLGRYSEAADEFRKVVSLDPDNFQARSNLGSALTMAGEFEMGRQVFEESLEIQPLRRTYSNLGVIYYYLGEFEKSVSMLRQAVDMGPGQAVLWLNLADSLHFTGEAEESVAAFRKARDLSSKLLSVDPSDSEAIVTLAWAKHMLGENQEALAIVEKSLAIDPGDPYGYYYDALIRYQSGDEDAALQSLEAALDKGYPPGLLVAEPHLGELRADDRFHVILIASFK